MIRRMPPTGRGVKGGPNGIPPKGTAMPTATVILPAAGQGRRFGSKNAPDRQTPEALRADMPPPGAATKVFAAMAGRPILAHTLDRFARLESVAEIIVPVPAGAVAWAQKTFGDSVVAGRPLVFVAGGEQRTESVARALEASDGGTELVVIHDAVRPLIRPAVIEEAMRVAVEAGAAVVGRPADHTIKSVRDGGRVAETIPRKDLWLAQTPQVFRRDILTRAYEHRSAVVGDITDDAQLVEAIGEAVVMVEGDAANVKITTARDLRLCEALLAAGWPFENQG